jgi:hypothetical protein
MRLKVRYVAVAAIVGAVAAVSTVAFGGSPHFIKNATTASLSGSDLVCNFKEAGLESGSIETVTCSATEAITYECVNNGGHNPQASNKRTFQTTGTASGEFSADRNGNIAGSLTITAASAASLGFSCPSGQTVTLVSVIYSDVMVSDADSGASISISGTFTYTNPSAP